jgi:hypothetical protein
MSNALKAIFESIEPVQLTFEEEIELCTSILGIASGIVNSTASNKRDPAQVLRLAEQTFLLAKIYQLNECSFDTEYEEEFDADRNLTEMVAGKNFASFRPDQVVGLWSPAGRELKGFIELFETAEEAYAAAKTYGKPIVYVGEVSYSEDHRIYGKVQYTFNNTDRETLNR